MRWLLQIPLVIAFFYLFVAYVTLIEQTQPSTTVIAYTPLPEDFLLPTIPPTPRTFDLPLNN